MSGTSPEKDPSPKQKPDESTQKSLSGSTEACSHDFQRKSDETEKMFRRSRESQENGCLIL